MLQKSLPNKVSASSGGTCSQVQRAEFVSNLFFEEIGRKTEWLKKCCFAP
jgi:hypothetical protein